HSGLLDGEGLTIVVSLSRGAVAVGPPRLAPRNTTGQQIKDFLGLYPVPIALTLLLAAGLFAAIGRLWWTQGRDRWYGDAQYLTGATRESTRPLFAHETIEIGRASCREGG